MARLYRFPGGFLIDLAGLLRIPKFRLAQATLPTGSSSSGRSKESASSPDCSHRDEPQCAIRAAVGTGAVTPERYASYRAIAYRERDERS